MKKVKELIQDIKGIGGLVDCGIGGTNGTSETSGTAPTRPTAPTRLTAPTRPTLPASLGAIAGALERIAAALEELVRTVKEKENIPPTPPIREREKEDTHTDTPRACVREGFLVPTLAEVAAFIKANGLSVDAEKFWNHYNAIGWKVGKSPIRCWQSVCYVWDRGDKRQALKETAQLAHFDAKMDERERKRECRAGGKGVEAIVAACDGERTMSRYQRILRNARRRLKRAHPELVEVFNLIVKNGSNRKESIWTMVSRRRTNGRQQETDTGTT